MAVVDEGAMHTSPHQFGAGSATYSVTWKVPSTPGATRFSVAAVAANGDGRNSGDEGVSRVFDLVFGCSPQVFFTDHDGDGYGKDGDERTFCAGDPPEGFAQVSGDCDNNRAETHPDAVELCNQRDDNCDGQIDENAEEIVLYPDADGDGYYSAEEYLSGDSVIGCVPYDGYAAEGGDCEPTRPDINPGAAEICDDTYDENCNGTVDDRLRPICGEGWCARYSFTCDPADCFPGTPSEEICNFLDDDCDGVVDNGTLCPEGQVCAAGECRDAEESAVPSDPSAVGGSLSGDGGSGVPGKGGDAASSGGGSGALSSVGGSEAKGGGQPSSSPGDAELFPSMSSGCGVSAKSVGGPPLFFWIVVGFGGLSRRRMKRSSRTSSSCNPM
jgi:hypothetical protein